MPFKKSSASPALEPRVYFTVVIDPCGLADALISYMGLRRLGFSLGFTYCHTRLTSHRRSPFWVILQNLGERPASLVKRFLYLSDSHVIPKIMYSIERRWPWLARILNRIDGNVLDFLGINAHFASDKTLPRITDFPKELRHRLVLSDRFMQENNLHTYDELTHYIKAFVGERKKPHHPLLLMLGREYPLRRFEEIRSTSLMTADPLDLRTIYFKQRKTWPQKSHFPGGHLKITAHLRLGDRAAFRTPWGTWMAHFSKRLRETYALPDVYGNKWVETSDERGFLQLTAVDFHQFMRELMVRLPPDFASAQLFSDGLVRTTECRLLWNIAEKKAPPSLQRQVRRLMKKSLTLEQRQLKSLFKSLPNSTCCIGEAPGHLFRLIHAVIESDVIIAAYPLQKNLVTCLTPFYGSLQTKPLVLLLHKPGAQQIFLKKDFYSNNNPLAHAVTVDISEPNFPMLAERIKNHNKPILSGRTNQG